MSTFWRIALILMILGITVGCDQATKSLAGAHLSTRGPVMLLGGTVSLCYAENRGAFLGLGEQLPPALRCWIFTVTVGSFLTFFLLLTVTASRLQAVQVVAAAALIGGGVGNMIDRGCFGFVRDFATVGLGPVRTGIFNLADMSITGGALVLMLFSFRSQAVLREKRRTVATRE